MSIRKHLNLIPYNSIGIEHALIELEQTRNRIVGVAQSRLHIDHKVANGKLLSIFSLYIRRLINKDEYITVSFYEFWRNIDKDIDIKFFEANETALSKGAKLRRIFAVKDSFIKEIFDNKQQLLNKHYIRSVEKIKLNKELYLKYKNNYVLDFVFLSDIEYYQYKNRYYNFGLINMPSKECKLLFAPNTRSGGQKDDEGSTNLHFIYNNPLPGRESVNNENRLELKRYEGFLDEVFNKFEMQKEENQKINHRRLFLEENQIISA